MKAVYSYLGIILLSFSCVASYAQSDSPVEYEELKNKIDNLYADRDQITTDLDIAINQEDRKKIEKLERLNLAILNSDISFLKIDINREKNTNARNDERESAEENPDLDLLDQYTTQWEELMIYEQDIKTLEESAITLQNTMSKALAEIPEMIVTNHTKIFFWTWDIYDRKGGNKLENIANQIESTENNPNLNETQKTKKLASLQEDYDDEIRFNTAKDKSRWIITSHLNFEEVIWRTSVDTQTYWRIAGIQDHHISGGTTKSAGMILFELGEVVISNDKVGASSIKIPMTITRDENTRLETYLPSTSVQITLNISIETKEGQTTAIVNSDPQNDLTLFKDFHYKPSVLEKRLYFWGNLEETNTKLQQQIEEKLN